MLLQHLFLESIDPNYPFLDSLGLEWVRLLLLLIPPEWPENSYILSTLVFAETRVLVPILECSDPMMLNRYFLRKGLSS